MGRDDRRGKKNEDRGKSPSFIYYSSRKKLYIYTGIISDLPGSSDPFISLGMLNFYKNQKLKKSAYCRERQIGQKK